MKFLQKKIVLLLVALVAVLTLSACTGEEGKPEPLECESPQVLNDAGDQCLDPEVPDTTAPVLAGLTEVQYTIGDDAPNYVLGVTANDDVDGDITASIVVDSSLVDLETAGTYTVTLTVVDAAGNVATDTFEVVVSERVLTAEELVAIDIASLDVSYDNLNLPTFTANGSFIFWNSSNSNVLTNRGFVFPPPVGSEAVTVTLTATVSNGGYSEQVTFDIVVQPFGEVTVTSEVVVPFTATSEEYVVEDDPEVSIYYVDNGTLPYMDIEEFITMIDGAIDSSLLVYTPIGDDKLEISYDVEWEDFDGSMVTETFTATIDFTLNTFTVNNYSFFDNYISSTESDYGEGLEYVDAEYVDPVAVTIPLGDYNFDILTYDDEGVTKYLMPFHVNNLLFAGNIYYDAYFNGDEIRGFSYLLDDPDEAYMDDLRTSSLNNADMADDVRWASVNFTALMLDYFYGLKEDQGVDTYKDMLAARASEFLTRTEANLYRAIFDLVYDLDDLHTSHSFPGFYLEPYSLGLSISDLGPRSTSFYEDGIWAMQDVIEAKYGSVEAMPEYELIDNNKTVVIHLTGFTIDTPDEYKAIMDSLPAETENVVIDLSYNTGGNLGAVLRIFGYMTEQPFAYHSQNPADGSAVTWWIESDYVAYDYNYYIITSKVTFSAANLMASMAKEQGIATVMGQKSSGGASSIGAFMLPDGSGVIISTNNVLSTRVGNEIDGYEYLSIEYGIDPEYLMSNVMDDQEIIDIIAQDQAE